MDGAPASDTIGHLRNAAVRVVDGDVLSDDSVLLDQELEFGEKEPVVRRSGRGVRLRHAVQAGHGYGAGPGAAVRHIVRRRIYKGIVAAAMAVVCGTGCDMGLAGGHNSSRPGQRYGWFRSEVDFKLGLLQVRVRGNPLLPAIGILAEPSLSRLFRVASSAGHCSNRSLRGGHRSACWRVDLGDGAAAACRLRGSFLFPNHLGYFKHNAILGSGVRAPNVPATGSAGSSSCADRLSCG